MSSFRIRPRFKHLIQAEQDVLEERILHDLSREEQFLISHLPGHIYIKIHPSQRHFWSPQLHLTFEQDGEHVIVRGLYGPNPTVWAIFFFGYAALGFFTLIFGMWGLSQLTLDMEAPILWLIPVFGGCALALYLASQAGQKIGAQQMFAIHHFYEEATGDKIVVN